MTQTFGRVRKNLKYITKENYLQKDLPADTVFLCDWCDNSGLHDDMTFWGFMNISCQRCTALLTEIRTTESRMEDLDKKRILLEHILNHHPDDGCESCQECCPHDERDHGICLDCEHDNNGEIAWEDVYAKD